MEGIDVTLGRAAQLIARGQAATDSTSFDDAIRLLRPAVSRADLDPLLRLTARVMLSAALCERMSRNASTSDEAEVIAVTEQAPPKTAPDVLVTQLRNYRASAMLVRYQRTRERRWLTSARRILTVAARHADDAVLEAAVVNNLAVVLQEEYRIDGDEDVLAEALRLTERAAQAVAHAADHGAGISPATISVTCTRASMIALRWRLYLDPDDLEEARALLARLLDMSVTVGPQRVGVLYTMASLLDDVASIEADRDAAQAAIEHYREALLATPRGTVLAASIASGLAAALTTSLQLGGEPDLLDEAISAQCDIRDQLQATELIALCDHNIAVLLCARFQAFGDEDDLDRAIELHERMVGRSPIFDFDIVLVRAGLAHYVRYGLHGADADRARAAELLSAAAGHDGPPVRRAGAARLLAEAAAESSDWALCADAAELGVHAVERMLGAFDARRWAPWLHKMQGLAALGGYAAAQLGDGARAVRLVERGCAVMAAGRLAQQRSTLARARAAGHGELVDAFVAAVRTARAQFLGPPGAHGAGALLDADAEPRTDAIVELDATRSRLAERGADLRPSAELEALRQLVRETGEELAYLVPTSVGGVALRLVPHGDDVELSPAWLPNLTDAAVGGLVARLCRAPAVQEEARRVRAGAPGPAPDVVAGVVDDLDRLLAGTPRSAARLVLVGPLGLLPVTTMWRDNGSSVGVGVAGSGRLHLAAHSAAGRSPAGGTSPTGERSPERRLGLVAVTDPRPCHVPGVTLATLVAAADEGAYLADRFAAVHHTGPAATERALLDALTAHEPNALHVATHAMTPEQDPDGVTLLLADGADGIAGAIQLDDLPPAVSSRVVFLACCWTARPSARLPDEMIGFPNALLQAGVACVVAPLWPIDDAAARRFVLAYYHYWIVAGLPSRHALAKARDELHAFAAEDPVLTPAERAALRATVDAFVLTGDDVRAVQSMRLTEVM